MFRGCIQSDGVVVHSVVRIKSLQFPELWKSSLHLEKCDFNKLFSHNILYLVVFSCINLPLTAKSTSEKLIAR